MNITLTPEKETFIQSQVEQGKYETVEQLLSEALRLLEECDRCFEIVVRVKDLLAKTQEIKEVQGITEEEIAAEIEAYRRGE